MRGASTIAIISVFLSSAVVAFAAGQYHVSVERWSNFRTEGGQPACDRQRFDLSDDGTATPDGAAETCLTEIDARRPYQGQWIIYKHEFDGESRDTCDHFTPGAAFKISDIHREMVSLSPKVKPADPGPPDDGVPSDILARIHKAKDNADGNAAAINRQTDASTADARNGLASGAAEARRKTAADSDILAADAKRRAQEDAARILQQQLRNSSAAAAASAQSTSGGVTRMGSGPWLFRYESCSQQPVSGGWRQGPWSRIEYRFATRAEAESGRQQVLNNERQEQQATGNSSPRVRNVSVTQSGPETGPPSLTPFPTTPSDPASTDLMQRLKAEKDRLANEDTFIKAKDIGSDALNGLNSANGDTLKKTGDLQVDDIKDNAQDVAKDLAKEKFIGAVRDQRCINRFGRPYNQLDPAEQHDIDFDDMADDAKSDGLKTWKQRRDALINRFNQSMGSVQKWLPNFLGGTGSTDSSPQGNTRPNNSKSPSMIERLMSPDPSPD